MYRPEWWPEEQGVLQMCENIHMYINGSLDTGFNNHDIYQQVRSLKWLIDNWKEPSSVYDHIIYVLINTTLNEYFEKYLSMKPVL